MADTVYVPALKAHVVRDENHRVRPLRHNQECRLSEESIPRLAANRYLLEVANTFEIPREQLAQRRNAS